MNGRTELERLLGALWGHWGDHRLPEPWSVTCELYRSEVQVHVRPGSPVARLADMLAWAYSFDETTARWRHTDTRSLHITVHGRSLAGVCFRIYGGIDFADAGGLVPLAPGDSEVASVEDLHILRDLLRQHHAGEVRP
ncbi:hypothetical protein LWP59_08605 [Amycolatopsis acidiphila]|uniref:Uncharacterized protein n=1 Tax=Amycolatopsis acidiphila TaxID=715473 RepID=A0A558ACY6_9PSEU|nr:hypothetical protein [Amycolatopsis acidiphila]TVT22132.1 hypothetical protein FNH06_14275 [Amycolatopsis acidiphila]UIJ61669.1 hypothetical protein LWP59_08605 [Amycolatopsis acidiphila]GHG58521.1 hypothetical protein GCM10017788_11250 [Amycolatopsis acidiphila]